MANTRMVMIMPNFVLIFGLIIVLGANSASGARYFKSMTRFFGSTKSRLETTVTDTTDQFVGVAVDKAFQIVTGKCMEVVGGLLPENTDNIEETVANAKEKLMGLCDYIKKVPNMDDYYNQCMENVKKVFGDTQTAMDNLKKEPLDLCTEMLSGLKTQAEEKAKELSGQVWKKMRCSLCKFLAAFPSDMVKYPASIMQTLYLDRPIIYGLCRGYSVNPWATEQQKAECTAVLFDIAENVYTKFGDGQAPKDACEKLDLCEAPPTTCNLEEAAPIEKQCQNVVTSLKFWESKEPSEPMGTCYTAIREFVEYHEKTYMEEIIVDSN